MHPELFSLGPFTVSSFLAAVVLGGLLAVAVALALAQKMGLSRREVFIYSAFLAVSFWLGSVLYRLVIVLLQGSGWVWQGPFSLSQTIQRIGTSVVGGILGMILFSFLYLPKVGLPVWTTLDVVFTAIPLAQAVGRIGCFLGGCCYGRPTPSILGVAFPGHSPPLHPVQLYESALNVLNFALLFRLQRRRKFEGQIFAWYLMNASLIRFVVEYWRGDGARGFLLRGGSPWTSLSIPQFMCLVGFAAGFTIRLCRRRKARLEAERKALSPPPGHPAC